jgi:tyrosyl-tRNA synthetase
MLYPILEGLGTSEKMSKSLNNYIGLTDTAQDMFGKTMRITDEQMPDYYALTLGYTATQVAELKQQLVSGDLHPRDAKMNLACGITALYHTQEAGEAARASFIAQFSEKSLPEDIPTQTIALETPLARLMVETKLVATTSEARRVLAQNGLHIYDAAGDKQSAVVDPNAVLVIPVEGLILQVGKRKFIHIFSH